MNDPNHTEGAAAAELALKAHVLISDPDILADVAEANEIIQEIAESVDLTEAPEDAVCSLVIDLLEYCEREKIGCMRDIFVGTTEFVNAFFTACNRFEQSVSADFDLQQRVYSHASALIVETRGRLT